MVTLFTGGGVGGTFVHTEQFVGFAASETVVVPDSYPVPLPVTSTLLQ